MPDGLDGFRLRKPGSPARCAKASSTSHLEPDRRRGAPRRASCAAHRTGAGRRARLPSRIGRRCRRACRRDRRAQGQSAAAAGRRNLPRPSQFLEWLADNNFTFLGVRELRVHRRRGKRSSRCSRAGSASCGRATLDVLRRGVEPLVSITPEIARFLQEPTLLIVTKAAVRSRVHRRVYMDYIGREALRSRDGKLIGEFRIVGLFTSTAYTRSTQSIPYLRRKVDAVLDARRLRSRTAIPARRWSMCWRAIRATSCSSSTRTRSTISRSRCCSSTNGRACACCRGATASIASSRSSSTCRASATATTCRKAIGDYLARGLQRPGRARSIRFSPRARSVRVHFIIARDGRRSAESGSRQPRTRGRGDRADLDRPARRRVGAQPTIRCGRTALLERYRGAFSGWLPRKLFAGHRGRTTSASSEGLSPGRPLGVDFHRRAGG